MAFLLDTNVVSELRRPTPQASVLAWFESAPADDLYLSVLVLGEIQQGVARLAARDATQAARHGRWLARLRRDFRDRLIGVDEEIALEWGRLNAQRPLPVVDGLLAATALVRDLALVTRNVRDYRGCGVRLVNPFA